MILKFNVYGANVFVARLVEHGWTISRLTEGIITKGARTIAMSYRASRNRNLIDGEYQFRLIN